MTNENQTHPDRNAVLPARENTDGATKKPVARDIVAECAASAATWTEKCRVVDAKDGHSAVLRILDRGREVLRNIADAVYFEAIKANRCETSAAEARSTDIQRYKDFMAASDKHLENSQRIEKIAAPLQAEIDRLKKIYDELNASPPVQA